MADDLFDKRLRELAIRASKRGEAVFTHFMDLNQIQMAMAAAREQGVSLALEGGYPDAERRMGAFYEIEPPEEWMWPIQPVELSWKKQFGSPEHRDLLGALMALGFERERMGDIVLADGKAFVFAEPEMADYIVRSLESAGRVSLKTKLADGVPKLPPPAGRTFRGTVASMRLDALLAAGFSLSRSEASERISRGLAYVNQAQQVRSDWAVQEGDLISLRGEGRVRIESVDGETRKGRIAVRLFRYGAS